MRALALMLLLASPAFAGDWRPLDGPGIAQALTGRSLVYADGTRQDFGADGRTLYGTSPGDWRVEGDRYCSRWPPADRWDCYAVEADGTGIRFTGHSGETVTGRYPG